MIINSERSGYLDAWKGITILAVIAIHASSSALTFEPFTCNWIFGLMFRQIVNFAVPLFLAFSGYFAGSRQFDTATNRASFWRSRLTRLAIPYLIWSFITILLRNPSHLVSPVALVRDILLGEGIGVGYFVIVLMQFVVVTPLISAIKKDWQHILIMALVTFVALAGRYYLQFTHPESIFLKFPIYSLPLVAWYPFYHLGFWFRRRNPKMLGNLSILLGLYLFFLFTSFAEAWLLGTRGLVEFATSQIKLSSFLMSGALFLLVITSIYRIRIPLGFLAWFGRNSYFVYLTHISFMAVLSKLISKSLTLHAIQPLYVATLVTTTSIMCGLIIVLIQRVIPKTPKIWWLGVAY